MILSKSVAELQRERVVLELECIDRMYLNAYVPQLTSEAGVAGFVRGYLGHRFASTKAVAQMTESFVGSITKSIWSGLKKASARTMSCSHGCVLSKRSIKKEWSLSVWPRKRRVYPERCVRLLATAAPFLGSITAAPM